MRQYPLWPVLSGAVYRFKTYFLKIYKMICTTKKITLIILLKTNGCKRLKMKHLKIHRTRKSSYLVNLINTCIHRAEAHFKNLEPVVYNITETVRHKRKTFSNTIKSKT